MLQITLIERGDAYYGCCCSPDDAPLAFQSTGVPLAQNEHECREWQAEDDNHGSTERLFANWCYSETAC